MILEPCGFWKAWFISFYSLFGSEVTVYTSILQNCICFVVRKKREKNRRKPKNIGTDLT